MDSEKKVYIPQLRLKLFVGTNEHEYRIIKFLKFLAASTLIALRPILGPAKCRFELSCTKFALKTLKELPLHQACWVITKRLLSCNPFF